MTRPRLLDLFCGAGGAAMGYYRAGFEVVGVDIKPQPHYPFEFHQGDALTYPLEGFDAYHASPPCQRYSAMTPQRLKCNHPDLIATTRDRLTQTGSVWVIENVPRSPVITYIVLCGTMFGLKVYRHRFFESNWMLLQPRHIPHHDHCGRASSGPSPKGFISVTGSGGVKGMNSKEIIACFSQAMGIDWMDRKEIVESIPPAYTTHIGKFLMKGLTK